MIPLVSFRIAGLVLVGALAVSWTPSVADGRSTLSFEADRKAILALAGDYHVTFDFKETVSYRADYKPFPQKVSGGEETVRVIEDTGRTIRLQHILVAGSAAEPILVKHWREDWVYEPASVLVYAGPNRWKTVATPATDRPGAWSQTVWQTDDSPRYGGVGRWRRDAGFARWTSDESLRPLARRDATRHPPYDSLVGVNRVSLTPDGWVHEQDNLKIGHDAGGAVAYAHENGVNRYVHAKPTEFPVAAADAYWVKTAAYWKVVRGLWDGAIANGSGEVRVTEEAENGAVTGPPLMDKADDLAAGKVSQTEAVAAAKGVIDGETARR